MNNIRKMRVKDIIAVLETMPQKAKVGLLWDGSIRSFVDCVYLAKSGSVVVAPSYELAYDDYSRPEGAPSSEEDPYYRPYLMAKTSNSKTCAQPSTKKEFIGMLDGKNIYAEIEKDYPKKLLSEWVNKIHSQQESHQKLLDRNLWQRIINKH